MERPLVFRLAVLVLGLTVVSQGQTLSFDVRPPPPVQLKSSHLWNITLQNPTLDTSSVYFHVEAYAVEGRAVFVANTQDFAVAPGEQALSARDIRLTDIWCDTGFGAFAEPDAFLPEGDYTYNLTLVPEMTLRSFILQVHAPARLKLVWPKDGAEIRDSLPLFVWRPPLVPGFRVEYRYSVSVSEVKNGQSCSLALSGDACVAEYCRSSQTAWRYGGMAGRLEPGRTYAWRVQAWDTAGAPVDTSYSPSRAGSFVYRPGASPAESHSSFEVPRAGQSVSGRTFLRVKSGIPDAELCVMEYSLGSDSAPGNWEMVGSFPRTQDCFVGRWSSDSAVKREKRTFGCPCRLRATVLDRQGQPDESAVETIVNRPPGRRRGCGCH